MAVRDRKFDILKAIGIILVVIGHSKSPFTRFIYLFHMPLFFFISGYFYKEEYSKKPVILIQKRLKTLWVPFVFYSSILLVFHNLFCDMNIYSNNNFFKGANRIEKYNLIEFLNSFGRILGFERTEQLAGAFWFLETLFIVNIIFVSVNYCINRLVKNKFEEITRLVTIFIIFFVGVAFSYGKLDTNRNFEVAFITTMFFYWGYLYKKYQKKIKINNILLIPCVAILSYSSFKGQVDLVRNIIVNPIFLLGNSAIGIYLMVGIANIITNVKKKFKLIDYIGENTVIILCIHFLAFRMVNFVQVIIYDMPYYRIATHSVLNGNNGWWIVYSIVGLLIPLFIKYISELIYGFLLRISYV